MTVNVTEQRIVVEVDEETITVIDVAVQGPAGASGTAAVAAHEADTSDAHDASAVSVVPFGTIAATNVQAALEEVFTEATGGGGGGAPSGPAGGVLSGTYPDPGFAVDMATQAELDAHAADTTAVHGIADTAALETTTGAQSKADAAQAAATSAAATDATTKANAAQSAATTAAATDATTKANAAQAAAEATASADATAKVSTHSSDTTAVHGIADTASLVLTDDARLSDARTPTTHAGTHAAAGTDPVTLTQAQITGLVAALAGKQATEADLDTIAALDSTTAGALVTDGAGWIRKTYAQLKTALGLVKADVGLGNVDNTADTAKPVSTAQQTALDLKAPLASPTFTGTPAAPTAAAATNTTQVATTAFVNSEAILKSLIDAAGDLLYGTAADTVARLPKGADGEVLTLASGLPAWAAAGGGGGGNGIFGDGSDGTVTITGTTTLTRDMFYDVLTVQSGGILNTSGFRVYCKTSCTIDGGGTMRANGSNASGATAGSGSTANALRGGSNGTVGATNGGTTPTTVSNSLGGGSGSGGAGSGGAGGGAGVTTAPSAASGGYRGAIHASLGGFFTTIAFTVVFGGVGGAGGGGNGITQIGGGGGGGGGVIVLVAKALTNNGTISALGGNGANGTASNGGGGGGGGGGVVFLVYNTFTGTAPSVAGGTKGLSGGGAGVDGANGSTGNVIQVVNA